MAPGGWAFDARGTVPLIETHVAGAVHVPPHLWKDVPHATDVRAPTEAMAAREERCSAQAPDVKACINMASSALLC